VDCLRRDAGFGGDQIMKKGLRRRIGRRGASADWAQLGFSVAPISLCEP
jgi:hypothetical protein